MPGSILVEIADVVQVALHLLVFDLKIGQRGTATDAPVDHPLAAVDESLVVEILERRANGTGRTFVQRERLTLPVARRAKPAVLVVYRVARLVHPLPDTLKEGLASDVVARQFICGKLPLDDDLRGDTRVVGARQIEGYVALHAVIPGECVFYRGRHRVAEVQLARDVGRRHDDGERFPVRVGRGPEVTGALPPFVQSALNLARVVGLRKRLSGRIRRHAQGLRNVGYRVSC